jgi:c-di-GMP-binding flagellar brake protein YcgR
MLKDILSIGDKIDIRQMDHSGKLMHNVKTYVSQLLDIVDADVINIAAPIGNNRLILLEVGESYQLCFYSNKGLYRSTCMILNNYREKNLVIAVVKLTSDLEKFQRRQYYRLEIVQDILYHIISREEEILSNRLQLNNFKTPEEQEDCRKRVKQLENEWLKASFTDLSGGGARFNSAYSHQAGDQTKIKFDINLGTQIHKLILNAEIIISTKLMNRTGVYEHRVEFKNISKNDRENLIKYIFEQERRRRKNEKL